MKKILLSLVDGGRVVRALGYSMKGLRAAYKRESAFRQELIMAAVMLPLVLRGTKLVLAARTAFAAAKSSPPSSGRP